MHVHTTLNRGTNYCYGNSTIYSILIVVGVNVAVNSINIISIAMETTAQDRGRCRALVNAVMNLWVP
jgi:hypothetical protein